MIIPKNPYQDADRLKSVQDSRANYKRDIEKPDNPKESEKSAQIKDKVELSARAEEMDETESGEAAKDTEVSEADRKTAGEGWYKHGYSEALKAYESKP